MQATTQLILARLENVIATNAGNRLTQELMRGMMATMTEAVVDAMGPGPAAAPGTPLPGGVQLVGEGVAELDAPAP